MKRYCVLILSHGRPKNVKTLRTLFRCGYSGDWYIVCDDEDKTLEEYKREFGDRVVVFSKQKYYCASQKITNEPVRKVILYARNACFDIARDLGYEYFLEFDDDYTGFTFRDAERYGRAVKKIDIVFDALVSFAEKTGCSSIAIAQSGDFIGGLDGTSPFVKKIFLRRKCMNSFVCRTSDDWRFLGIMNEDVNTYLRHGAVGRLFFTTNIVALTQVQTQAGAGGMTDVYLASGTYKKSFLSVIVAPGAAKVFALNTSNKRIHHKISWRHAVPKIVREG